MDTKQFIKTRSMIEITKLMHSKKKLKLFFIIQFVPSITLSMPTLRCNLKIGTE